MQLGVWSKAAVMFLKKIWVSKLVSTPSQPSRLSHGVELWEQAQKGGGGGGGEEERKQEREEGRNRYKTHNTENLEMNENKVLIL